MPAMEEEEEEEEEEGGLGVTGWKEEGDECLLCVGGGDRVLVVEVWLVWAWLEA